MRTWGATVEHDGGADELSSRTSIEVAELEGLVRVRGDRWAVYYPDINLVSIRVWHEDAPDDATGPNPGTGVPSEPAR